MDRRPAWPAWPTALVALRSDFLGGLRQGKPAANELDHGHPVEVEVPVEDIQREVGLDGVF
jgi:hypothetical protein